MLPPIRLANRIASLLGSGLKLSILLVGLQGCFNSSSSSLAPVSLSLTPFASGLNNPVGAYSSGTNDSRLFVIEKGGTIRIVRDDGTVAATPFLDISARVDSDASEEGLLGLAFHPDFAANGLFYINYTNTTANIRRSRISRFSVTANPDLADPGSESILFTVEQPFSNHNAGDLHFGPDGLLYIPLGDGGSAGDPNDNAQNLARMLGKIVRIDVDGASATPSDCNGLGTGNYTIPPSNPFIDGAGGNCDEVLALGLRNPWRSSFDRANGDLFIGDVGQNAREEINWTAAGTVAGTNYGWRCFEGLLPFNDIGCGPASNFVMPIFDYINPDQGCSVIGGYVYRGARSPDLFGRYLLTDFCSGTFWDIAPLTGGGWQVTEHSNLARFGFVSFGEGADGELYVVHQGEGTLSHLSAR